MYFQSQKTKYYFKQVLAFSSLMRNYLTFNFLTSLHRQLTVLPEQTL